MKGKTAAVTMKNITKKFGPVVANDKVNLEIYKGEILALLGENGSGKTTLMNMLSGIYFPDEGQIFINGKETVIRSPKDAYACGIGMVHQHFKLIDVLTAAENIVLGMKGTLKSEGGFREDPRDLRQIWFRGGPGPEDLQHVRLPETDGGDRQSALPRSRYPDSGRAHGRTDPAGDREAV